MTQGTWTPGGAGSSDTIASAPRSIAWCANTVPSACRPFSATNTWPRSTARESYAMPVTTPTEASARTGSPARTTPRPRRIRCRSAQVIAAAAAGLFRSSTRRHTVPRSSGSPAAGSCETTKPSPDTRAFRPSFTSRRIASRALSPRRSGTVPAVRPRRRLTVGAVVSRFPAVLPVVHGRSPSTGACTVHRCARPAPAPPHRHPGRRRDTAAPAPRSASRSAPTTDPPCVRARHAANR